jgi:hypothetical protein
MLTLTKGKTSDRILLSSPETMLKPVNSHGAALKADRIRMEPVNTLFKTIALSALPLGFIALSLGRV